MKLLLVGGGTGGHILPFVSLVEEAQKKGITTELVLADALLDRQIYQENFNIPVYFLKTGKIRRYFDIKNITAPFKIINGLRQAQKIVTKAAPDAVFFKGGFVCFPLLMAVLWHNQFSKKKIRIFSHESDISVGVLSKIYAKYADFVFESFSNTENYPLFFSANSSLFEWKKIAGTQKLLVFGGSQGAQFLNDFVANNLQTLAAYFEVCVVTGKNKSIPVSHKNLQQFELLSADKLRGALESADIVLSRAGANSLFEILSNQKKSVIVPLPTAARNHQLLNAQYFFARGCIELFEQSDPRKLCDVLLKTSQNQSLDLALKKLNFSNAAPKVIQKIIDTISAR